jgi:hypothetical protein
MISEKISSVFYQEMRSRNGVRKTKSNSAPDERNGIVRRKAGVWKLRRIIRGLVKGTRPLCRGNEDVKHIPLSCPETKIRRMQFMSEKWLSINEELAHRKIVNCTNEAYIINLGEYLDKVRHKWESKVRKVQSIIIFGSY